MVKTDKIDLPGYVAEKSLEEIMIEQTLDGLKIMPMMVSRYRQMASSGDKLAQEVIRRYDAIGTI